MIQYKDKDIRNILSVLLGGQHMPNKPKLPTPQVTPNIMGNQMWIQANSDAQTYRVNIDGVITDYPNNGENPWFEVDMSGLSVGTHTFTCQYVVSNDNPDYSSSNWSSVYEWIVDPLPETTYYHKLKLLRSNDHKEFYSLAIETIDDFEYTTASQAFAMLDETSPINIVGVMYYQQQYTLPISVAIQNNGYLHITDTHGNIASFTISDIDNHFTVESDEIKLTPWTLTPITQITQPTLFLDEPNKRVHWDTPENVARVIVSINGDEHTIVGSSEYDLSGLTLPDSYEIMIAYRYHISYPSDIDSTWSTPVIYVVVPEVLYWHAVEFVSPNDSMMHVIIAIHSTRETEYGNGTALLTDMVLNQEYIAGGLWSSTYDGYYDILSIKKTAAATLVITTTMFDFTVQYTPTSLIYVDDNVTETEPTIPRDPNLDAPQPVLSGTVVSWAAVPGAAVYGVWSDVGELSEVNVLTWDASTLGSGTWSIRIVAKAKAGENSDIDTPSTTLVIVV